MAETSIYRKFLSLNREALLMAATAAQSADTRVLGELGVESDAIPLLKDMKASDLDKLEHFPASYRRLLFMQIRFRQVDISTLSLEAIQNELDALEAQEKRVMLAWARSTQNINPGLLADVESGHCRYTNAIGDYLNRTFLGN